MFNSGVQVFILWSIHTESRNIGREETTILAVSFCCYHDFLFSPFLCKDVQEHLIYQNCSKVKMKCSIILSEGVSRKTDIKQDIIFSRCFCFSNAQHSHILFVYVGKVIFYFAFFPNQYPTATPTPSNNHGHSRALEDT